MKIVAVRPLSCAVLKVKEREGPLNAIIVRSDLKVKLSPMPN